jgi:hypothetical protein
VTPVVARLPSRENKRSNSDSALYKRKFSDFLKRRPTFLTRNKSPQRLPPLDVVKEGIQSKQAPLTLDINMEPISFEQKADDEQPPVEGAPSARSSEASQSQQKANIEALEIQLAELKRAQSAAEARKAKMMADSRKVKSADELKKEIPRFMELLSIGEEAVKEGDPSEKEILKVVCGLPCNSRRREKELNYTLDVLTGTRAREMKSKGEVIKVEKKVDMKKLGASKKVGLKKRGT